MSHAEGQVVDIVRSLEDARALVQDEQWEEALSILNLILKKENVDALISSDSKILSEGLGLLGVVLYKLNNLSESISVFDRLQYLPDASSDVPEILAVLYALAGRIVDALYYGKLAAARPCDNRLLDLLGEEFPKFADVFMNIVERPLVRQADGYFKFGQMEKALFFFEQHLSFDGKDEEALLGKARTLFLLEQGEEAVKTLRYLRQLRPDDSSVVSLLASALTASGNVLEAQACHRLAIALEPDDIENAAAWMRDVSVFPGEADRLRDEAFHALLEGLPPEEDHPQPDGRGLKIGYLVVNLTDAQKSMVAAVVDATEKDIPVVLYGAGEILDAPNKPYQKSGTTWRNVAETDAYTFAEIVRGDEISVLVNVSGWRAPSYLEAHLLHPAAVQVSWLNSPSWKRFPGIDWRLADREGEGHWVLPFGDHAVNPDHLSCVIESVEKDDTLTFGVDSAMEYLSPDVILCWARILLECPGARLVLKERSSLSSDSLQRLTNLFGDFGVAHRIEIAHESSVSQFVAGIDVLLVPFRDSQVETVVISLLQGVPVVTLDQTESAVRSILKALNVDERMSATDEEDFIAKAVALGEDSDYRETLAEKIKEQTNESPVFSAKELAKALNTAFRDMLAKSVN